MVAKAALVKLLAMRQHDGDADRAAGIARGVDQGRCLIGLLLRDSVVGCGHDRHEDERQSDAPQHSRPRHAPEAEIAVYVGHALHGERDEHRAGDYLVFGLHLGRWPMRPGAMAN